MRSRIFTFEWPFQVNGGSVYVTGTFDNWTKSTKLSKDANGKYSATLRLPEEKIIFKYVVDGSWLTTPKFSVEKDPKSGIENNVLYPEDFRYLGADAESESSDNFSSYETVSPNFEGVKRSLNYNQKSDTESSAFTNISAGEISPIDQSDFDAGNEFYLNTDDSGSIDSIDHEMFPETQGTVPSNESSDTVCLVDHNSLMNLQNSDGNRQIRYFTNMSVLTKFREYFA